MTVVLGNRVVVFAAGELDLPTSDSVVLCIVVDSVDKCVVLSEDEDGEFGIVDVVSSRLDEVV